MPFCPWCKFNVNSYEEHNTFFGAYTCKKREPTSDTANYFTKVNNSNVNNSNVNKSHVNNSVTKMEIDKEQEDIPNFPKPTFKFDESKHKKLYHQTSLDISKKIFEERRMKPGLFGLAGPAIYFATKPEDTHHKAYNTGVILECWVELGRILQLPEWGNSWMTRDMIKRMGFDSALIPRLKGYEYAVYEPDRIKYITVYKSELERKNERT
jgi:hypothetical protein